MMKRKDFRGSVKKFVLVNKRTAMQNNEIKFNSMVTAKEVYVCIYIKFK